ncbi:peptidoglycan D,D-transpeptidase FtsI family protein [Lysinibacillus sp. 3P01SB]|uniref:peptidoglycan D,D-transpeptidase FtsI family protein n=1 Tax=Lysinibacillus sp. 3P01SB TaxID=3132284 RepID=UPI0039A670C0
MRKPIQNKRNQKPKAKQRASLTFRMNVLFFSIFLLFSVLIFRLGYLQIVKGEDYVSKLAMMEEVKVNTSVPRGRIYDRNGRILVDNVPENAITYTKLPTTKTEEMVKIAESLAALIDMPTNRVTARDKEDFWILLNAEEAKEKVTTEEMNKFRQANEGIEEKEVNREYDKRVRERITEEELASLTEQDMEVLAIYREMTSGYNLSPQIIKSENVTDHEFALVSERLSELPGVNTTTDWKRVRLAPVAVLGRTTTPNKGIPKSQLDHYLAREYSRNDRVGESYFEAQYEELLQGEKSVVKNVTNKKGEVVETLTTYDGEPGKDLVTTLDIELQQKAEEIVEKYLLEAKRSGSASLLDRAFYVMMDPKTGEILSMVGKKIEYDEETGERYLVDYSYGNFTTAYEAGSTVKGATVLTGYREGAIQIGSSLIDERLYIGGVEKSSVFNRYGRMSMNDLAALEQSSNVYMFKIALSLGGLTYYPGMGLNLGNDTLQKMRNGYNQMGLGVRTGVDLPGETTGIATDPNNPGNILDLSIGQFDTYTPLQLAQYVSTIANGGYRIQPRMLKEIRNPSTDGETMGALVEEIEPKILNRIDNTEQEINRVKEGFRRVYIGAKGSAARYFRDAPYTAAGKTGTAEVKYYDPEKSKSGIDTLNLVHVGFAPYENPEVAYAVVLPWATTNFNSYQSYNNMIARDVLDAYFELKEKRAGTDISSSTASQKIQPALSEEVLNEDEEEETVNE